MPGSRHPAIWRRVYEDNNDVCVNAEGLMSLFKAQTVADGLYIKSHSVTAD